MVTRWSIACCLVNARLYAAAGGLLGCCQGVCRELLQPTYCFRGLLDRHFRAVARVLVGSCICVSGWL